MTDTRLLPVLPLDDDVVLPGMIVPLELDDAETRAAVDSAQSKAPSAPSFPGIRSLPATQAEVLIVPRVHGEYAELGAVATIERVAASPAARPPSCCAPPDAPGSARTATAPARRAGCTPSRSPRSPVSGPARWPPSTRPW